MKMNSEITDKLIELLYRRLEEREEQRSIEGLLREAQRSGLEGLVAERTLANLEGEDKSTVKALFVRNFCQGAAYLSRLKDIDARLSERGIEAITLKGLALSLTLYKNKIGVRELSDIDILVHETDLESLRQVLVELGYSIRLDTDMGYAQDGYYIDLHTTFLDRVERAYSFGAELAWANRIPLDDLRTVQGLSNELNFCYLAVHGMEHGFSRLKWLVDLAFLLPFCESDSLKQFAVRTNSVSTVSICLASLQRLLDSETPPSFVEDVEKLGRFETMFVNGIVEGSLPKEVGKFLALWNASGVAAKAEVFRRVAKVDSESWGTRVGRVGRALKGLLKG